MPEPIISYAPRKRTATVWQRWLFYLIGMMECVTAISFCGIALWLTIEPQRSRPLQYFGEAILSGLLFLATWALLFVGMIIRRWAIVRGDSPVSTNRAWLGMVTFAFGATGIFVYAARS